MSLKSIVATFECDGCGKKMEVPLDLAHMRPKGWALFDEAEDALRGAVEVRSATGPELTPAVVHGLHLCSACEAIAADVSPGDEEYAAKEAIEAQLLRCLPHRRIKFDKSVTTFNLQSVVDQRAVDLSTDRVQHLIDINAVPRYLVQALLDALHEARESVTELKVQNEAYSRRDHAAIAQVMHKGPYVLVVDNNSQWYVIPKSKQARWESWLLTLDAELFVPTYAIPVGGSPSSVAFTNFELQ